MIQSAASAGKMTQREFENLGEGERKKEGNWRTDGRRESRAGRTVGSETRKKGGRGGRGRGREEKVSCYAFQMPQPYSLD